MRLFALVIVTSLSISPVRSWADPPSPPQSLDQRIHATEKAVIEFRKAAFSLQEHPEGTPHVEILVEVDSGANAVHSQTPARHVESLVDIDSNRTNDTHPRAFPNWIRVALDDFPAIEHTYSDRERHALAEGGLQPLLAEPFTAGRHTLAVTFTGISQSGQRYTKTKGFTFETIRPVVHVVLRFLPSPNEEPQTTLDVIEQPWLESPLSGSATPDAVYRLGIFASGAGDYETAAVFFLTSLGRPDPVRPDQSRLHLAEAYAEVGLPEEAEAILTAVVAQTPDEAVRARAWLLIERVASRHGRHARAIEAYEQVDFARLGPSLPSPLQDEAHLFAGTSALVLRQYPRAAAAFRRVANPSPDRPFALYGQAQAVAGSGDAFTANSLFKQLTESRSPSDPVQARVADFARVALGFQWLEQGQYGEALSELGQVRPDHPAYEAALFGVGWAFQKTGEQVKAIAIFQDLIARFPRAEHVHQARLAMAASYADLRAYTRAVMTYRTALEAGMASLRELDQRHGALDNLNWDPLAERLTDGDEHAAREDTDLSRSIERYRWFLRSELELRRTLDRVSESLSPPRSGCSGAQKPCPNAQRENSRTLNRAQLVAKGRALVVKVGAIKGEFRGALKGQAREALDREQQRLEEWSVQASVGIARNLIADRDELGSGALTLD